MNLLTSYRSKQYQLYTVYEKNEIQSSLGLNSLMEPQFEEEWDVFKNRSMHRCTLQLYDTAEHCRCSGTAEHSEMQFYKMVLDQFNSHIENELDFHFTLHTEINS